MSVYLRVPLVRQIGYSNYWNCALYGKSLKFGTEVENHVLNNFRYSSKLVSPSDADHALVKL